MPEPNIQSLHEADRSPKYRSKYYLDILLQKFQAC